MSSQTPDPSETIAKTIDQGLAALSQKDGPTALRLLNAALETLPPDSPLAVKAQMGLVKTYAKLQQPAPAAALLKTLQQSHQPQVQNWANQALKDLSARHPAFDAALSDRFEADRSTVSQLDEPPVELLETEERPAPMTDRSPSVDLGEQSVIGTDGFVPLAPAATGPRRRRTVAPTAPPSSTDDFPENPPELRPPDPDDLSPIGADRPRSGSGDDRAARWSPLGPLSPARLQRAQIATVLSLPLVPICLYTVNYGAAFLRFRLETGLLKWSQGSPNLDIPWIPLGLILVALAIASPWILDFYFRQWHGLRPLPTSALARYSPEGHRLVQRLCQQQNLPLPTLALLPTTAPLILSYGSLPRNARIVVSQGLLESLADDEIAALYAAEIAHIQQWDFGLMSWVVVALQIPHLAYWQASVGADRLFLIARAQSQPALKILSSVGGYVTAALAALSYGLFWCLRWSGLLLSRWRLRYSDRASCNATGNPNGLARALLKVTIATAQHIRQAGQTDYLLEAVELLAPVGCRSALTLGSGLTLRPPAPLLAWDLQNDQRFWLATNNSHPPLGQRLAPLMQAAQTWRLAPLLDLSATPQRRNWGRLLMQGAPMWGVLGGYGLALGLWALAWLAYWLQLPQLAFLGSDFKLFYGLPLMGFAVGTALRSGVLFPDRRRSMVNPAAADAASDAALDAWLSDPSPIPIDGLPTDLTGQLLGRRGVGNWLGQDLILQSPSGWLLRLHYCTPLGSLGNWLRVPRPADWVGQSVTAAGWLRRGATPWLDLDRLRPPSGQANVGGHRDWSTYLTLMAMILGFFWML
jgi:Zn-dependent protease with chaperone function